MFGEKVGTSDAKPTIRPTATWNAEKKCLEIRLSADDLLKHSRVTKSGKSDLLVLDRVKVDLGDAIGTFRGNLFATYEPKA